jgi:hypothetical protein
MGQSGDCKAAAQISASPFSFALELAYQVILTGGGPL